jgi:hypothetical protein
MKKRHRSLVCMVAVASLGATAARAQGTDRIPVEDARIVYELVGQVTNPTPTTSVQYGYFTRVRGVEAPFSALPAGEATARFTFFREATNVSVVNNGPLRVISRVGTTTVYFNDVPGASFASPDSFRAGRPIQTSTVEQQVVVDTTSAVFTVVNVETITDVAPFTLDGVTTVLGAPGERLRTVKQGRLNSPGPPAGWFGGYTLGVKRASSPSRLAAPDAAN